MAALLRTALYRNVLTVRIPETKYVHGHFSQFGRTKFTSAQSLNDESVTVDDDSAVKHVPADSQLPALDLSFNSSKEAYRSKSTAEIARALFVFNMCSIPFLVNHNKTVSPPLAFALDFGSLHITQFIQKQLEGCFASSLDLFY